MTEDRQLSGLLRWSVAGPWLWLHRLTHVLLPVVIVVAAAVLGVKYAGGNPPPWWLPVVFAVAFGWAFQARVRTATEVELGADGILVFRRWWLGPLRVPAVTVRSIGRPAVRGRRSGVKVWARTGTVSLAFGMRHLPALVEEIARYSPELQVGRL